MFIYPIAPKYPEELVFTVGWGDSWIIITLRTNPLDMLSINLYKLFAYTSILNKSIAV